MTSSLAPYFSPVVIEGAYSGIGATAQAAYQKSNTRQAPGANRAAIQQLQRDVVELNARMIGGRPSTGGCAVPREHPLQLLQLVVVDHSGNKTNGQNWAL
ncbi:hypothetical protein DL770_010730 [Monosporascus sp. CRB-9-2]|nr:hypothetical protein DL770_010730 [Monosporascus sp. CRB-9-2]